MRASARRCSTRRIARFAPASARAAARASGKRAGGDQIVSYTPELGQTEHSGASARATASAKALGRSLAQDAFRFVYQPIVNVRERRLFAYEALCRACDPSFADVGELFETAVRTGRIRELGRILRRLVVVPLDRLPEGCSLFVNLHPQDLG